MSNRTKHLFQFSAAQIAAAANGEAEYHLGRLSHWKERQTAAIAKIKETARVKTREVQVTGGTQVEFYVETGDPETMETLRLSYGKIQSHREAADKFKTDANVYASQAPDKAYELDASDVYWFRLGGNPREE